jgi:hypothetical protein
MNRIGGGSPPVARTVSQEFLVVMKLKLVAKKAGWRENPGNIEAKWLISAECMSDRLCIQGTGHPG